MLGFFLKKRILIKKLKSYVSIIKLSSHIRKNRKLVKKLRKISDEDILSAFCCNIEIPKESEEAKHMIKFNKLLISLSKISGYYNKVRIIE